MSNLVVKTKDITKIYGKIKVVNNVNITVKQGEIYGLVGKNGAGKTTLLKMISGLTMQTSGELELFSTGSKKDLEKARSRSGCVIETPSFFPYLSAKKNLEYYRIQRGIPEEKCVDEALELVGLSKVGNKKFKSFSLGMKQRLGLALAIMGNPDFLILDEPINGLDPMGIVEFRELLKKLNREKNITILISSHILGELAQLATTYGFINNGILVEEITAKEIEEKCRQCITVKVSDTKKACTILEEKLKCNEYEVLNNMEIRIFKYIDAPEKINEELVLAGIKVSTLNITGSNLENYFIDLIGGRANA